MTGGAVYALLWAGFVVYLALIAAAPRLPEWLIWGTIGVALGGFALAPPLLSHDVYSYISYARLEAAHGLNPYEFAPHAVPGDPAFVHVGWRDAVSAYGPAFSLLSWPLGLIGVSAALAVLKAVAALSVAALAGLCARLAAWRGADPRAAAVFVALNPLVLVHVVGGAHNDALMALATVAGVAALLGERPIAAGGAFVLAAALKVSGAFVAPFALAGSPGRRGRLLAGGVLAAAAVAVPALLVYGSHFLESLGLAGENQARTSRYSIPATLSRISGLDVGTLRLALLIAFAILVVFLLYETWRGMDWVRAAGWAAFALLLATGWLLPWYLIWALPLASISRDRALTTGVLTLTAFQLINRVPL